MIQNRNAPHGRIAAQPYFANPKAPVDGILATVGGTPLVRLERYLDHGEVTLLAKLEAANPGGSAKDRPALHMLSEAIRRGEVHSNSTVIESSSGNMGVGLAQTCRYYGLDFVCVSDPYAQSQNIAIMRALGARIIQVTEQQNGSYLSARLAQVRQLLETIPDSYWPNQYANMDNPAAHEEGAIREIDEQLQGKFDFLFVATSSTGTARGCREYLRKRNRQTQVVCVDAVGSVLFGGTRGDRKVPGLGAGAVPELAAGQKFNAVKRVTDADCVTGCRRAAHREAMLIGGSAGGVLEVVRSMQSQLAGKTCVAILHDSGTRYLDTIYCDEWVVNELGVPLSQIKDAASPPVSHPG